MADKTPRGSVDPQALALSHLAHFLGVFVNQKVLSEMKRAGYAELRESHGYLVQHLLRRPHSVGELAKLLGVTQQAVSKTVAELTRTGYLETTPGDDARVRLVRLTDRGHASVTAARRFRQRIEARFAKRLGERKLQQTHAALLELLNELGGLEQIAGRRVPSPESTATEPSAARPVR